MKKQLILKNEVSQILLLEEFVESIGQDLSLEPELVMNLNLVLEEAVSNVIMYAYPANVSHNIIIDAQKIDDSLIFIIKDTGVEFDPTKVKEADISLSAEERSIGGLGIFLISKIMDTIEYQRIEDENILTLTKKLN